MSVSRSARASGSSTIRTARVHGLGQRVVQPELAFPGLLPNGDDGHVPAVGIELVGGLPHPIGGALRGRRKGDGEVVGMRATRLALAGPHHTPAAAGDWSDTRSSLDCQRGLGPVDRKRRREVPQEVDPLVDRFDRGVGSRHQEARTARQRHARQHAPRLVQVPASGDRGRSLVDEDHGRRAPQRDLLPERTDARRELGIGRLVARRGPLEQVRDPVTRRDERVVGGLRPASRAAGSRPRRAASRTCARAGPGDSGRPRRSPVTGSAR